MGSLSEPTRTVRFAVTPVAHIGTGHVNTVEELKTPLRIFVEVGSRRSCHSQETEPPVIGVELVTVT